MSWLGTRTIADWRLACALCLACVLGCGGKLDDEGGETPGGLGSAGSPAQSGSPPRTDLPPCRPGFDPNLEPTRPCDWLAKELCYAEKIEACACICPRNRKDSVCSSDFYFPNGRTEVRCN